MVAYAFNAQQFEPKYGGSGGLPVGKYKGVISNSRQEMTQDQQGGFLALDVKVIEGPLAGQFQTDRLNLHNKNPLTVEIANKQLSAYCHVTGKFVINDTAELHNIPFMFEVRQQKKNPEYTEIAAIWDINGNEPGKTGAQPQAPAAPVQPPPMQPAPAPAPAAGGWGAPTGGALQPAPGPAGPAPGGWGAPTGAAPTQPGWGNR